MYKFRKYKQSTDKENWSPNIKRRYRQRVFTDSTETAVVNMGVNTNPDISATCTVIADGNILPSYFIYPESQIKHATGNSVKQPRQNNMLNFANSNINQVTNNSNNPVINNVTNNITNKIHIHIPDTDEQGSLYTTTEGGSMTPERLVNFIKKSLRWYTSSIILRCSFNQQIRHYKRAV